MSLLLMYCCFPPSLRLAWVSWRGWRMPVMAQAEQRNRRIRSVILTR